MNQPIIGGVSVRGNGAATAMASKRNNRHMPYNRHPTGGAQFRKLRLRIFGAAKLLVIESVWPWSALSGSEST